MEQQPAEWVGQLGAIAFVIVMILAFAHGWCNPHLYKAWHVGDLFKLGEIHDNDGSTGYYNPSPTNIMRAIDRSKQTSSRKPEPKPEPEPSPEDVALFDDCVGALVGLGYKKTESKKAAVKTFHEYNPSTVEEFIHFVFLKKS